MKKLIVTGLLAASVLGSQAFAWDYAGKVTSLNYTSGSSKWANSNDLVIIQTENGFSTPNCHNQYAAIRKVDSHLIGAVELAVKLGSDIKVELDSRDIFHQQKNKKCIIRNLRIEPQYQ